TTTSCWCWLRPPSAAICAMGHIPMPSGFANTSTAA
ncbi:hypothetical protein ATCCBAA256_01160, partial [Mycobacterium montefiorense]